MVNLKRNLQAFITSMITVCVPTKRAQLSIKNWKSRTWEIL